MTQLIHPDPHPRAEHETRDARASYMDAIRRANIHEAVELVGDERPAAALMRMARSVEAQMAVLGLAGIRLEVGAGMARVRLARLWREQGRGA